MIKFHRCAFAETVHSQLGRTEHSVMSAKIPNRKTQILKFSKQSVSACCEIQILIRHETTSHHSTDSTGEHTRPHQQSYAATMLTTQHSFNILQHYVSRTLHFLTILFHPPSLSPGTSSTTGNHSLVSNQTAKQFSKNRLYLQPNPHFSSH